MHWFWNKNKQNKPVVIHDDCYKKLHPEAQKQFSRFTSANVYSPVTHTVAVEERDDTTNFALSAMMAMETDSILLGTLTGGSFEGAVLGEMMADSGHNENAFGGGDGGGGGAGDNYGPSSDNSSSSYDSGSSGSDSTSSCDSGSGSSDSGASVDLNF